MCELQLLEDSAKAYKRFLEIKVMIIWLQVQNLLYSVHFLRPCRMEKIVSDISVDSNPTRILELFEIDQKKLSK